MQEHDDGEAEPETDSDLPPVPWPCMQLRNGARASGPRSTSTARFCMPDCPSSYGQRSAAWAPAAQPAIDKPAPAPSDVPRPQATHAEEAPIRSPSRRDAGRPRADDDAHASWLLRDARNRGGVEAGARQRPSSSSSGPAASSPHFHLLFSPIGRGLFGRQWHLCSPLLTSGMLCLAGGILH